MKSSPTACINCSENVKEMGFEVFIGRRCEVEQRALDGGLLPALFDCSACGQQRTVFGDGAARRLPLRIMNAALLGSLNHFHEFAKRVQAAGEASVCIKLNQHFFNVVH